LAAGTSLGGISGLIDKDHPELVVVGFLGSAVGGLLGWSFYMILAFLVVHYEKLKGLAVFQAGGLQELQKVLDASSKENLKKGFSDWTEKFSQMISITKSDLLGRVSHAGWEKEASTIILIWLTSAVDTLALVFGTLADRKQYQSRVTIIVYRVSATGETEQAKGIHWISYPGQLTPHHPQNFDETSIGYKVLKQQLESPYFTTKDIAQKDGQSRASAPNSYRPFITFRLNGSAVLALDWPEELAQGDNYVEAAQSLFYATVTPALTEVLNKFPKLADAAEVPLLDAPAPKPGAEPEAVARPAAP
jgi:hypothetical protein